MMEQFMNTLVYGGLAGFATIVGILLILYYREWARRNSVYLIGFAVGTLLGGSFLHIIPESIELYGGSLLLVLVGFLVFYILEHTIMLHSCKEETCPEHLFGVVAMIGLGFHSLVDGIAIGAGFEIGTALGIITALAVLFHEVPEGISAMGIMIHSGVKTSRAVLYSVIVAILTPIGALVAFFLLGGVTPEILGGILAFVGGSFLYVAASDLIPETHKRFKKWNLLAVLLGIGLIYALGIVL